MDLTVVARTDVKDLVIDYIDVITQDGKVLSLNWEWSSITRVVGGFMAEYVKMLTATLENSAGLLGAIALWI